MVGVRYLASCWALWAAGAWANNGELVVSPERSPVVALQVAPFGRCSGSLLNTPGGPAVLTAAHCLVKWKALVGLVRARRVEILLRGRWISAGRRLRIHPSYLNALETGSRELEFRHDLALVPLSPGGAGLRPLDLGEALRPGERVHLLGWGSVLPSGDFDDDGVENNRDFCPLTRVGLRFEVETEGRRRGCAEGEVPVDLRPGLRGGGNVVREVSRVGSRVPSGMYLVDRELRPGGEGWREFATPGAGDSGGPLLDVLGRVVGVMKGGRTGRSPDGSLIHEAYYVNLSDPENGNFVNSRD